MRARSLLLGLCLGLAGLALACGKSDDLPTIEAQLVAPPNVPPAEQRNRAHVVVRLEIKESEVEIAPGVRYRVWTFNGSVPGPMIRVHLGDVVEIRLKNSADSHMTHNIDLHAVNGPGGGAEATDVAPGEEKAFTFKALAPGLFVYHCAAGIVADHIGNGMYGAILVEPVSPLTAVDREYYVGQNEFYTTGATGDQGLQTQDFQKLLAEEPAYVVFDGNTKSLTGQGALQAEAGQTVRLYFVNGGPNLTSSFHVIGEILDKVWQWGTLKADPVRDVQTTSVPPGGAMIATWRTEVPGDYILVDHAISRVSKGAAGVLHVTGAERSDVFNPIQVQGGAASPGPAAASPTAGTPSSAATPGNASSQVVSLALRDNVFAPNEVSVPAGSKVSFQLKNEGQAVHNLQVADASGSFGSGSVKSTPELLTPGQSGGLEWQAPPAAGTYNFRCEVHPIEMTGRITVQ